MNHIPIRISIASSVSNWRLSGRRSHIVWLYLRLTASPWIPLFHLKSYCSQILASGYHTSKQISDWNSMILFKWMHCQYILCKINTMHLNVWNSVETKMLTCYVSLYHFEMQRMAIESQLKGCFMHMKWSNYLPRKSMIPYAGTSSVVFFCSAA